MAFLPTLVAVGWILIFHQPHSTLFRGHVTNWSNDMGIDGFVNDMGGPLLTMLAFGLGLGFGLGFDTVPARRPTAAPIEPLAEQTIESDADRPIAREREEETVVRS